MPYQMMIGAKNRGCILLLVDQSSSMSSTFGAGVDMTLAAETARAVNGVLREIALTCQSGDTIKDRCDVGVIGYGSSIGSILLGFSTDRPASIRDVALAPSRVELVKRKVPDGAGGVIELDFQMPIWVEPVASGGTPMAEAFDFAREWVSRWCAQNPRSFPPVVVNITDGESYDMDEARQAADRIKSIATDDGNLLLFSAHISAARAAPAVSPSSASMLPDEYSRFLFNISSEIPPSLRAAAAQEGLSASAGARGFVYNADASQMISLLRFGTVGTMMAMGRDREN